MLSSRLRRINHAGAAPSTSSCWDGYPGRVRIAAQRQFVSGAPRAGAAGRWWGALALPAGVLAVHQLRYLLAFGSHAGSELSARGDHYVASAAACTAVLLVALFGRWCLRLAAARRGNAHVASARAPLWLLWLALTCALIVGFCALEVLEIALEPHRSGGVSAIFGYGGWWSLPAAAAVAAVLALVAGGGRALLLISARGQVTPRVRAGGQRYPRSWAVALLPAPMAGCAAGRAPPFRRNS